MRSFYFCVALLVRGATACTNYLVTPGASSDGSALVSYAADSGALTSNIQDAASSSGNSNLAAVSVLVSIPGTSVVLELCSTSIPASVNYTLLEQVPSRFGSRLSEIRPTSSGSESVNASNASTSKLLKLQESNTKNTCEY